MSFHFSPVHRCFRILYASIILAAVAPAAQAEDSVPAVSVSPDGQYSVYNIGESGGDFHFEIRTKAGEILLTSKDEKWEKWMPSNAHTIKWSGERYVLLCYDDGRYRSTAVYSFAERTILRLPHVTDGWTTPDRWVSARTFVVKSAGPKGGKASREGYYYRQTYRIRTKPFRLDCVYTSPVTTWKDKVAE